MAFFWPQEMLQVRIEGNVLPMPRDLVEEYFQSRDLQSQVASSISKQSTPLESRQQMLDAFQEKLDKTNEAMDLPDFWKGWLLDPVRFEFFIYREHRLNDRFLYTRNDQGSFDTQRLWP